MLCYTLGMTVEEAQAEIRKIVFTHLEKTQYSVYLFGSRAKGTPKELSDFDIGILGQKPLELNVKIAIEDDLEKSKIPFIVEIVDLSQVGEKFRDLALKDAILWN